MKRALKPGAKIGMLTVKRLLPAWEKGGMAYVVLAHASEDPDNEYALKIAKLEEGDNTFFYDSLQLEANLLRKLDHPGIVKLQPLPQREMDRKGGKPQRYWNFANEIKERPPYFLMEYLPGGTLTEILNEHDTNKIGLDTVMQFAIDLSNALEYLHDHNYVHNDIKPNNVMFRKASKNLSLDKPVLIDFGISTTRSAPFLDGLTMRYAAPEKLLHAIDSHFEPPDDAGWMKVDTWGLGVILYQLMTKEYPYNGNDPDSMITTIRTNKPKAISNFRKIPKAFEELILDGCLCSDISTRLSSQEVHNALARMV